MSDKKPGRPPKNYKTEILGYRINKELKRKFAELCDEKGYLAQRQLELMLEEWINKEKEIRFPRPKDLPHDIAWSEIPSEGSAEEFDMYVFKGDMSIEEFEKTQDKYFKNKKESGEDDA